MTIRLAAPAMLFSLLGAATAQANCKSDIEALVQSMKSGQPYRFEQVVTRDGKKEIVKGQFFSDGRFGLETDNPKTNWPIATFNFYMDFEYRTIESEVCGKERKFKGKTRKYFAFTGRTAIFRLSGSTKTVIYVDDKNRPEWLTAERELGEIIRKKSNAVLHFSYDNSH